MPAYPAVKPRRAHAPLFLALAAALALRGESAGAQQPTASHSTASQPATGSSTAPATPPAAGAPASNATVTPGGDPVLVPLSPDELNALRPLAQRGVAILVRDPDAGPRARITVLARVRAPMATVHRVITAPQDYGRFMPTLSSVEVISRARNRVAFRFHVTAAIFEVTILANLHAVSDRRVDIALVQSDIGPGASRWDLVPDGDGTWVSLSTWGDPSRGTWILRQVAARSPAAIAGMNISTDVLLLLSTLRHAEILAGRALPERPAARFVATGNLEPPPPGPWLALARTHSVAAITLDPQGAFVQSTVAAWTPTQPASAQSSIADITRYTSFWHAVRESTPVGPATGDTQRFRMTIRSSLSSTTGEIDRVTENSALGPVVWWRGASGDYANTTHRWDVRAEGGGSVVLLTGGSEYSRASWMSRAVMDRDVWLVPGYAASWKLVWLRQLIGGL